MNYRKGGEAVRNAWFAFKKDNTDCTQHPKKVTSFVAGWNAALAHFAQTIVQAKYPEAHCEKAPETPWEKKDFEVWAKIFNYGDKRSDTHDVIGVGDTEQEAWISAVDYIYTTRTEYDGEAAYGPGGWAYDDKPDQTTLDDMEFDPPKS